MLFNAAQLHHAYALRGEYDIVCTRIFEWKSTHRPETPIHEYIITNIEEARALGAYAHQKQAGTETFFLVALKEGRIDIQNTLLKTLEEPAQGIHFFIHIPDHITLLPTIASRVELVTITRTGDTQNPSSESDQESTEDEVIIDAETFLSEAPSARLAHIKKLKDASELSKSSTGIYYQFLSSIEHILGAHRHHASLAHIYRAKEYMSESGSSPKMILEYLAMHLPIIAKD